jgi:hypothetical protein
MAPLPATRLRNILYASDFSADSLALPRTDGGSENT